MTNEELVKLIQDGENVKDNITTLYTQNLPLIRQWASRCAIDVEIDDLLQEAYFALLQAIKNYDLSLGVKFMSYAERWVKARFRLYRISNGSNLYIPTKPYAQIKAYKRFEAGYMQKHGKPPNKDNVKQAMQLSDKEYYKLKDLLKMNCTSLDAPIQDFEDVTVAESIADEYDLEYDVVDRYGTEQDYSELWEVVEALPEREQYVIKQQYRNNQTQKAISEHFGISNSRVSEISRNALKKLKNNKRVEEIANYYGYERSTAYHYGLSRFKTDGLSSVELLAELRAKHKLSC